jgi:hypothetical protein
LKNKLILYPIFLFFGLLFVLNKPLAQNNTTSGWFVYFGNQKINNRFYFYNEIQYRNFNFIGDINQFIARTGIGYEISKNNNLLLGYGFIKTFLPKDSNSNKDFFNENRIYQQFLTKHKTAGFYFIHRVRLEERFLENNSKIRFRYFLSINKAINKKTIEKNALYFSAYNEIFLNPKGKIFDRNRIYGGLGFAVKNDIRIETGYMLQSLIDKNQKQIQIILINNLPLNK